MTASLRLVCLVALLASAAAAVPVPAGAQELPPIAAVDFYGPLPLSDTILRRAVALSVGAPPPDSAAAADIATRLEALSAIGHAEVASVCCDGGTLVYVGVFPPGAPATQFRAAPTGDATLPAEVAAAVQSFDTALRAAAAAGDFAESDSLGHSLMHFPAARRVQERFVQLAGQHRAGLAHVLRTSADADARAGAAQVLAYAPDKSAVVDDLAAAMTDPDPGVRNNAMRALALIAGHADRNPALGISVPFEPFVGLLRSPVWTDRNKASFALVQLTAARDPARLALLDREARAELEQMARWTSVGHALPALMLLGRIRGLSDDLVFTAVTSGDRGAVLAP